MKEKLEQSRHACAILHDKIVFRKVVEVCDYAILILKSFPGFFLLVAKGIEVGKLETRHTLCTSKMILGRALSGSPETWRKCYSRN